MRESGHTPSRLVVPARTLRTILAGAVLLACAGIAEAQHVASATNASAPEIDAPPRPRAEAAFAVPRLSPAHPVALPAPLAPSQAVLLRMILATQARGKAKEAASLDAGLDTATPLGEAMLGHVLADRYLGPGTHPDAKTLEAWLARWPTLAEAPQIHALLLHRLPAGQAAPPLPALPSLAPPPRAADAPDPDEAEGPDLHRNRALDRDVLGAARGHIPYAAARLIAKSHAAPDYAAALRAEAGHALFLANRDREAYDTAAPATHECAGRPHCETPALAGLVAGLAAWRMDEPDRARPMFEAAWLAGRTTANQRAAAAFWAARAHKALRDAGGARTWLRRAAREPATFYGLLARRILGMSLLGPTGSGAGAIETLGEADVDALLATASGEQAFALLQAGARDAAEAELELTAAGNPALARSVMLVALRERMATLAAQAADLAATKDGQPREAIRFTLPDFAPRGGFTTDPALILGIARAESNFDVRLVSSAGARGLMQIMPATARFITGGRPGDVLDPANNLALGERYVAWLGAEPGIGASLLKVLASYNAGPAAFARRSREIVDHGDPLLFLEAIPIDETRAFIPRVLTYTWLYAARMGRVAASLDALAADAWPVYRPAP
jgi:soluble lytic murein transglycosylase